MKKIGSLFNFLSAGVIVTCLSCSGQNANTAQKLFETKQDTIVISDKIDHKDTTDIDTALQNVESLLNDYKNIHIAKASDTLKYKYLRNKWEKMDITAISSYDSDGIKHSIRVKYYTLLISLFEEICRVNEEGETAGLKGGLTEKELKALQESMDLYKRKLWLETH